MNFNQLFDIDGDWLDETHTNPHGWEKLAQVWFETIHQHLK
jgi:hypothetical protein